MDPFTLDPGEPLPSPKPRPSWVLEKIRYFNRGLESRQRERKYSRMAQSSFAFFRGSNHLFWSDFGPSDLLNRFGGKKGTRTWINGDAHCDNFGSFADATGRLVYDLNDFDESVVADFQFDLWRLGISLVLVGRQNKRNPRSIRRMVESCCRGYWREIKSCHWYKSACHSPWDEEQASGSLRHYLAYKREEKGFPAMLKRWTREGKGVVRFKLKNNPDLEPIPQVTAGRLRKALKEYAEDLRPWPVKKPKFFDILDLARRLNAGIGSEGHHRFYALVRVKKKDSGNLYRILDIKRQFEPSCWEFLPKKVRRKIRKLSNDNHTDRVVLACKALGRHVDPWLGRLELPDGDYSIRERSPFKGCLPGAMVDEDASYQLGAIMARAHCRAKKSFANKAFDHLKGEKSGFRALVQAVSHAYADQVEMDFHSFLASQKKGLILKLV
jgi:uncharacterized protein (DUF2252 family)